MLKTTAAGVVRNPAVLLTARAHVDLPAIVEDGGPTWTFHRLAVASAAVARDLGSLPSGATVAVSAPNGGALVAAIAGVWLAGGAPALVSPALPGHERDEVLEVIHPAAVVLSSRLGDVGDLVLDEEKLLSADIAVPESQLVPSHSPALILFTSGTTGEPKGVVYTMRMAWGLIDRIASREIDPDSLPEVKPAPPRGIIATPMAHLAGVFGTLFSLWRGRAVISMLRFDPNRYGELVRQHGVQNLALTPTMMRMLLDADPGRLAPPAKIVTTGAAPVAPSLREEFEARFEMPVQISYGQTESGVISFEPLSDLLGGRRRPGTVGRVVPGIRVQIRDENGETLPTGMDGQIWVRGGDMSPSLLGADDRSFDEDGWLSTGDLGLLDDDGYLTISGRTREMIIRGGFNIVPAEVERELLAHPAVVEAAVVGVPDGRLGEVPHAWVRLAPNGATVTSVELSAWLHERLAPYKVPVEFRFVDDFARTETGKIRKQVLH